VLHQAPASRKLGRTQSCNNAGAHIAHPIGFVKNPERKDNCPPMSESAPGPRPVADRRFPVSFFRSRWRGSVPLRHLLLHDMLIYGTTINVVAALLGLLLFASDAPTALATIVYLAPLPYNVFLFAALWKSAADAAEPWASIARIVGLLWLVAAALI
jgi:hypothetical protein